MNSTILPQQKSPMRIYLSFIIFLFVGEAYSQEQLELRASPLAMATARYKNAYVKITYSQPQKKQREIFGKLVPYGEVWRTGANEATEITATQDIMINDQQLKAGTYSIFTIPDKEKWTIIFNRDLGLWGAYNYNPKMDVFRFEVKVETIPNGKIYEPFTVRIDQKNDSGEVFFLWDKSQVKFAIRFIEPKP